MERKAKIGIVILAFASIFLLGIFFHLIPLAITMGVQYSQVEYNSVQVLSINGHPGTFTLNGVTLPLTGQPTCPANIGNLNGYKDCFLDYFYVTPSSTGLQCSVSNELECSVPQNLRPSENGLITISYANMISPGQKAPVCPETYDGEVNVCLLTYANAGYNITLYKAIQTNSSIVNQGQSFPNGLPPSSSASSSTPVGIPSYSTYILIGVLVLGFVLVIIPSQKHLNIRKRSK